MSVRIESEVGLRETLDGLAQQKEILFDGGYEEGRDEELYQGLFTVIVISERPLPSLDERETSEAISIGSAAERKSG